MPVKGNVLIVDDEPNALRVLSAILKEEAYAIRESTDVEQAISVILDGSVDAIITDVKMPVKDGFHLFDYVAEHHPHIPVVFLTAYGTVESAVTAMTNGAFYYFIKPPDYVKLKTVLVQAIEQHSLKKELADAGDRAPNNINFRHITGTSPSISRVRKTIEAFKDSESSILIQGETGTGKEIVACNLHYSSKRNEKPFVAVNCAAIPRELMESELFGYEKGAFTGAASARTGKFEEAAGGTVFLDEIGELELSLQAKLLRVLQERTIERLGSNKKIKVNFRLISSTNRDLSREIKAGRFREDLFYRINVVQIDLPPLRERRDDIPHFASEFLTEFCSRENKLLTVSKEVMDIFMNYPWPGNVRQLRNVIERAAVLATGRHITPRELPVELRGREDSKEDSSIRPLKELEHRAIQNALLECNGNKSKAARKLGISRKAFYKKLKETELSLHIRTAVWLILQYILYSTDPLHELSKYIA